MYLHKDIIINIKETRDRKNYQSYIIKNSILGHLCERSIRGAISCYFIGDNIRNKIRLIMGRCLTCFHYRKDEIIARLMMSIDKVFDSKDIPDEVKDRFNYIVSSYIHAINKSI